MKNIWLFLTIFLSLPAGAQYYYKDIVGNREINQLISLYTTNKVRTVTINSFNADGSASPDFFVQQVLVPSTNTLKTITRSGATSESVLIATFDARNRVIKTIDTSGNMISTSNYMYDEKGNLISIKSFSTDSAQSISETEEHNWFYNVSGNPERMQRIINKGAPAEIKLIIDDKGNIAEEQTFKKGVKDETIYYYYDVKNRMTDVVRFNKKAKRLLPDYMFEYSDANQVIQKITVPASGFDYLIWRYQYDAKGLKIREACFDRQKQLTGKIEYNYRFDQ